MFGFEIKKRSQKSRARIGVLKTSHGEMETPTLVPVATQAVVKTLTSEEAIRTETQILIANTFHLHLKPGEKFIKSAGGLHKFMNWPRPMMTDSGGFQVFSLGFGKDHGVGKILKGRSRVKVKQGDQPKLLRIGYDGVLFRSPVDGREVFLGPKESIKIQETLGADIIFAFDECPPPHADKAYVSKSLKLTHRWAEISLRAKSASRRTKQAIYGIVQGGRFKDLRKESARLISSLPFDGIGIGGEFGKNKKEMSGIISAAISELPENMPRHLLGIGHPEDIIPIIKAGVDTFDCTLPTHYARHGVAFVFGGSKTVRLDMNKSKFLYDKKPLDPKCACEVCAAYARNYISHLFRAKEITALRLLTFHNLFFFNSLIEKIRRGIRKGVI